MLNPLLLDIGIVTEAKNEEGLTVKVSVGILVHTVKKRAADDVSQG